MNNVLFGLGWLGLLCCAFGLNLCVVGYLVVWIGWAD